MNKKRNPHDSIRKYLPQICSYMLEAKRDPTRGATILDMLYIIERSGEEAGGKTRDDVQKLVKNIRLFLEANTNPQLLKQILEDALRLRQDATEI